MGDGGHWVGVVEFVSSSTSCLLSVMLLAPFFFIFYFVSLNLFFLKVRFMTHFVSWALS